VQNLFRSGPEEVLEMLRDDRGDLGEVRRLGQESLEAFYKHDHISVQLISILILTIFL
jgi:hypothetical protein